MPRHPPTTFYKTDIDESTRPLEKNISQEV